MEDGAGVTIAWTAIRQELPPGRPRDLRSSSFFPHEAICVHACACRIPPVQLSSRAGRFECIPFYPFYDVSPRVYIEAGKAKVHVNGEGVYSYGDQINEREEALTPLLAALHRFLKQRRPFLWFHCHDVVPFCICEHVSLVST